MITKEVFQYLKEIGAQKDYMIDYETFFPIRDKISIAAASNYLLEDKDGEYFWFFLDELKRLNMIQDIFYVMEDLWTEGAKGESFEELFELSEESYLRSIFFKSNLSDQETESKIVKVLTKEFKAECCIGNASNDYRFITWDY